MKYEDKDFFPVVGLRSDVLRYSSVKNDDKEVIGHITMLDIEGYELNTVKRLCSNMFDVAFVLRSSKDAYHVYNPVIRSFDETHELMKSIGLEDKQHVDIGYKRGDWVLRISDKPADGKIVPELVHSHVMPNKRLTYSYPHLQFLLEYFNVYEAEDVIDKMPVDGKSVELVKYWTFK